MPIFLRSPVHRLLVTRLREIRKAAGLRQAHVAERLGVQQSYVAKVEGGERRLDLIEFLAYMRALEADPIALIEELLPVVAAGAIKRDGTSEA